MGFKNFLISIIKSLIIFLVVTLIFSMQFLDAPALVNGALKDIFQYASPAMQKEIVSKLTASCSPLEKGYATLQEKLANSPLSIDFKKIGSLCKDYNSGNINDKEFFFGVIGSAIPDKLELPKGGALGGYNSAMDFLNKNKVYSIAILFALAALLYLLAENLNAFLTIFAGISLSIGVLILLPYAAIITYDKLVGIDTTPLLSSILQGSFSFDLKAVISVILLMVLRTYNSFIVALGSVFLSIGIAGKIYSWRLKKQSYTSEAKRGCQKRGKTKKETDEDAEEAHKRRDRSTKEILDELEEMHKNKIKEKENE